MKLKCLLIVALIALTSLLASCETETNIIKLSITPSATECMAGDTIDINVKEFEYTIGSLDWFFVENTCGAEFTHKDSYGASVYTRKSGYFKVGVIAIGSSSREYIDNKGFYFVTNTVLTSDILTVIVHQEVVEVNSVKDFLTKGSYAKYVLKNDIDFAGDKFDGLLEFYGEIEGNNYSIKNLYFEGLNYENLSLIMVNRGIIRNLNFTGFSLFGFGASKNAALIGENYGIIENVRLYGIIFANLYSNVGGIVASNFGTIKSSSNFAQINGGNKVGGIAGENQGLIIDCVNQNEVLGKKVVGGIVGYNLSTIAVSDCINNGKVVAIGDGETSVGEWAGGIAGTSQNSTRNTILRNCHNFGVVEGDANTDGISKGADNIVNCTDYSTREGN